MRRKSIRLFLVIMLIFISCILTGFSSTEKSELMIPDVKEDVYVYDQGKFLDDQVEAQMNKLLVQLEEKTTIEFAVITIPTLNDLTIESYAVKLGNELGIGKAKEDNGILLLISKKDSKVRLEIGRGLQGVLTDSISGRILDEFFVPYRAENNYDDASINTIQAVINSLAESEEYDFSIDGLDEKLTLESEEGISLSTILLIIIVLIVLEWITGNLFGNGFGDGIVFMILSSSSSSSSSSGRSSGGRFGGGGFNGGGASR